MKNRAYIVVCMSLICLFAACSQKPIEETKPIEEIVISTPPEYEVPAPPKPTIGEDGVWLADDELLYGMAQPVQREMLNCDQHRRCDFIVRMDYRQVRAFLGKYFPYQKYKYYKAVDLFEILPELKDQYKEGGIVPTFDPKIKRPEPGQAGKIVVSWMRKYNAYVWHYTSAFAINEEKENERLQQEEQERKIVDLAKRILENGSYAGFSNDELSILIHDDLTPSGEDIAISPTELEYLKEIVNRANKREAETTSAGIVPSLKHIDALPTIQPPAPESEGEGPEIQRKNLLPAITGEPDRPRIPEQKAPRPSNKGVNLLPAITGDAESSDTPAGAPAEASP